jgi:hypothetical protein
MNLMRFDDVMPEFSLSAGVSWVFAPPTSLRTEWGIDYRVGVADVGVEYDDQPLP